MAWVQALQVGRPLEAVHMLPEAHIAGQPAAVELAAQPDRG